MRAGRLWLALLLAGGICLTAQAPSVFGESLEMPLPESTSPPVGEEQVSVPMAEPSLQLLNPFNSPFSQQNFVPDISLVLDLSAGLRNLENETFASLLSPLRLQRQETGHAHTVNTHNGFNFNYAELTLQSPVDPFFDLFATFHLSSEEFEIEEAYFNTRGLPGNIQFKGGKFLSHFGRINAQHAHFWNFSELPLIYQGFFGTEALNELGFQFNWLAPTDFFLNLGLELLQGSNSESYGTQGFLVGDQLLREVNLPNLVVVFTKASWDLSEELVLLGGVSHAQGGSRQTGVVSEGMHLHQALPDAIGAFAGGTRMAGADLTLRWLFDSYRELTWQSEFLLRSLEGSRYNEVGRQMLHKEQSGFYSELVWRFAWQWRTGLRLDLITRNDTWEQGKLVSGPAWLPRYTAMLEYHPSEFSRLRLEYSHDSSRYTVTGQQSPVQALFLQLNLSMGAHGAHNF